jgi:hypothetical protein
MSMIHLLWNNVDEAYQRALKAKVSNLHPQKIFLTLILIRWTS